MSERDGDRTSLGLTLAALVFAVFTLQIVVSGVGGILGVYQVNDAAATTTATVTETDLTTDERLRNGERRVFYEPAVTYHYTVDGRRYNSSEFYYDADHTPRYGERSEAQAALPDSSETTVYYLPENPDQSFLVRPSPDWVGTAGASLAVLPLCLLAAGVALLGLKRLARQWLGGAG